jgi:nitrite reductase (NADH) large subunit
MRATATKTAPDKCIGERCVSADRNFHAAFGSGTDGMPVALPLHLMQVTDQESPVVKRIVVLGHGMVAQRLLEHLCDTPSNLQIAVLSEESVAAYDRVQLSSLFSGSSPQDLALLPNGFLATHRNVTLALGESAVAIDRVNQIVHTSSGRSLPYDRLVIATGSRPFVPPVPGADRPGCFVYRTIEDVEAIKTAAQAATSGVVIGGGLLGLEAAKALRDLGLRTQVVEFAPRLMAVQVDEAGGALLRELVEALGVQVHTGKSTTAIVDGSDARHRLIFADGTALDADMVVFSAGIRPRDELARAAGLDVGLRGGIAIDNHCRSSDPAIFAVGECALWSGRTYGLVAPGYQMARVAAATLRGDALEFTGADMSTKLKLLGIDVASIGDAHAATPGARVCSFADQLGKTYRKIVTNADGSRLLGAVLVGDAGAYGELLQLALNGLPLPPQPEDLILPARSAMQSARGVASWPDAAQICSCNNVTKGDLCAAVVGGSTTVGALKSCTKAATSCGGCAPLVAQVLKAELARQGVVLDNHLCEHFAYSRQQLHHLVRIEGIRSFVDLLASHGKGRGCDICKPAVASILASCWNEYVLSDRRAPLQDTNDRFLANIQKDGTYSVVPRIPGGEITPEKLIAIGAVGKRYGLYTKITGGQRIDLFGAQLHELPAIWRELIAAGFESGHAYGKAMRTVKSCVGSTWCRYGVQDSVSLAIELEQRYRGLRAPHKIKLAVSGCTRECAEAQSKDVGVIATERGWNLYVCGNGGMKPRHAELLASDLDKDTLIRYVDRFLMFYVRTADRLQRTATWRDHLEGGLDYLKQVVCADSLGIAAELEADMTRIIDSYECEWQRTVNDPAAVAKFRHFVNSDQQDSNVVFVRERGQRRPATTSERMATRSVVV